MSRATVDLQSVRFFLGYGLIFIAPVAAHDPDRRGGDARAQPALALVALAPMPFVIWAACALRAPQPAGAAGGAAADRRADRGGRGEHLRRARRQGVRAGGAPAASASTHSGHARVRPVDGLHPAARLLQPADRLPAPARPRRRCCSSAAARRSTARSTLGDFVAFYGYVLMLTVADADARHRARDGPARGRLGHARVRAARPRAAADARRRTRRRCPAGGGRVELRGVTLRLRRRRAGAARTSTSTSRPAARSRSSAPTGSGKTTLVMLIPRLYDVDAGAVLVDGVDVRERRPGVAAPRGRARLRRRLPVLGHAAREHRLRAARTPSDEEVATAAAARRPPRRSSTTCPTGYDTLVGERGLHALGRPAPARRDRPRAARRPAHPDPRRRDLERRRHHREPRSRARCAR